MMLMMMITIMIINIIISSHRTWPVTTGKMQSIDTLLKWIHSYEYKFDYILTNSYFYILAVLIVLHQWHWNEEKIPLNPTFRVFLKEYGCSQNSKIWPAFQQCFTVALTKKWKLTVNIFVLFFTFLDNKSTHLLFPVDGPMRVRNRSAGGGDWVC